MGKGQLKHISCPFKHPETELVCKKFSQWGQKGCANPCALNLLHKTECKYWMSGNCNKPQCRFYHPPLLGKEIEKEKNKKKKEEEKKAKSDEEKKKQEKIFLEQKEELKRLKKENKELLEQRGQQRHPHQVSPQYPTGPPFYQPFPLQYPPTNQGYCSGGCRRH